MLVSILFHERAADRVSTFSCPELPGKVEFQEFAGVRMETSHGSFPCRPKLYAGWRVLSAPMGSLRRVIAFESLNGMRFTGCGRKGLEKGNSSIGFCRG